MSDGRCRVIFRPREFKDKHPPRGAPVVTLREVVTRINTGESGKSVTSLRFILAWKNAQRVSIEVSESNPKYPGFALLLLGDSVRSLDPLIQDCLKTHEQDAVPAEGALSCLRRTPTVFLDR